LFAYFAVTKMLSKKQKFTALLHRDQRRTVAFYCLDSQRDIISAISLLFFSSIIM
jgi:hypothetical protein